MLAFYHAQTVYTYTAISKVLTNPSGVAGLPDLHPDEERLRPPHAAVIGHHGENVAVGEAVVLEQML
jgi:hypothetical protein